MRLTFREGRYRLSVARLLWAIVAMFVVMPFVDQFPYGGLVEAVLFTLLLLAGINAVGGRRRTQVGAALLSIPTVVARWLCHLWPDTLPMELYLLGGIAFVAFVIFHLFRFVLTAPQVNSEVLCAAISIYLLLAVVWSILYTLLARWDPAAIVFESPYGADTKMTSFTALYFSVQMLTTIAFGDIMPASNVARMMTLVEATAGVLYMAILVARLVGLYSTTTSGDSTA